MVASWVLNDNCQVRRYFFLGLQQSYNGLMKSGKIAIMELLGINSWRQSHFRWQNIPFSVLSLQDFQKQSFRNVVTGAQLFPGILTAKCSDWFCTNVLICTMMKHWGAVSTWPCSLHVFIIWKSIGGPICSWTTDLSSRFRWWVFGLLLAWDLISRLF